MVRSSVTSKSTGRAAVNGDKLRQPAANSPSELAVRVCFRKQRRVFSGSSEVGNGQRSLRQHGHARGGSESLQFSIHGGGDVGAGRQMTGPQDFVGQGAVNEHARAPLNQRLDLSL